MEKQLNYVPKKRKANYKIVVPFVFLLLALTGVMMQSIVKKQEQKEELYYKICDYTANETKQTLDKRQKEYKTQETIALQDYTVYGETLTLYQDKYKLGQVDGFSGNTIFLNNLCQLSIEDKQPYLISNDKDIGIEVYNLEDGLYELEILSDFKFKRFVTEEAVDDVFRTAKRNGVIKEVRIVSDKEIFNKNHEDKILDKNYLFLEIKTIEKSDEVDVVLNPSRLTQDEFGNIDYGHFYYDVEEATETFKMADKVASILKQKGVRVAVLRDDVTPINNFGEKSRVKNAYDMNAKYMVNMRFESSGSQMDQGVVVLYSSISSNRFASHMASKLINETSLNASPYNDRNNPQGVFQTSVENGLDFNDIIRETGGRLTGAGRKEGFESLTAYAKESNFGMNTIDILYGYMTHPDDLKTWENEFDLIAEKTAEAILVQLGMQGE